MKRPFGVQIDGSIYANNGEDIKHDEFWDAFVYFIESKGWCFGGGSFQIDKEGERIDDLD